MDRKLIGTLSLPGEQHIELRLFVTDDPELSKPNADVILPLQMCIRNRRYKSGKQVKCCRYSLTRNSLTVAKPPNLSKLVWMRITPKKLLGWARECLRSL